MKDQTSGTTPLFVSTHRVQVIRNCNVIQPPFDTSRSSEDHRNKEKRTVNMIAHTRTRAWHVEITVSGHETAAIEQIRISFVSVMLPKLAPNVWIDTEPKRNTTLEKGGERRQQPPKRGKQHTEGRERTAAPTQRMRKGKNHHPKKKRGKTTPAQRKGDAAIFGRCCLFPPPPRTVLLPTPVPFWMVLFSHLVLLGGAVVLLSPSGLRGFPAYAVWPSLPSPRVSLLTTSSFYVCVHRKLIFCCTSRKGRRSTTHKVRSEKQPYPSETIPSGPSYQKLPPENTKVWNKSQTSFQHSGKVAPLRKWRERFP